MTLGIRKTRKVLPVAERRRQLSEAACKLFSERGYHDTTIKEVAQLARVAVGSPYSYFADKEELLFFVFQAVLQKKLKNVREARSPGMSPESQLRHVLRVAADGVFRQQNAIQLLYRESIVLKKGPVSRLQTVKDLEAAYVAEIEKILEQGIQQGSFRELNVSVVANSIALMLAIWPLRRWNLRRQEFGIVFESIEQFVLAGVMKSCESRTGRRKAVNDF